MGYLGLDESPVKDDNLFQRMFWPSDHAGEADALGKQGFWVCFGIAILSLVSLALLGQLIFALFTAIFFLLGGIGVREHSQPAAILVAAAYVLNIAASLAVGQPPGAVTIIACLLLLANIRGTFIAAKWAAQGDPEVMPERRNETFGDKLSDQMPLKVWPKTKILFFVIGGLYLMLSVLGTVAIAMHLPQKLQHRSPAATLDVSPTR